MKRTYLLLLGGSLACWLGSMVACTDDPAPAAVTPADAGGQTVADTSTGTPAADTGTTRVDRPDAEVFADELTVKSYSSDPNGLSVNSYVVYGKTNAILIDGQFFNSDAAKVVELIKSTGKNLKYVLLTHAHPDHFLGFKAVKDAFPNAQFVASPNVAGMYAAAAQPMLDGLKGVFGPAIADSIVPITPLPFVMRPDVAPYSEVDLDGNAILIYLQKYAGDVATFAVVTLPDKSVFSGDLVFNKVHANLSECTSEGWNWNLNFLAPFLYNKYYPGHGAPGTFGELVPATGQYIAVATAIMRDQAGFGQIGDASAPPAVNIDAGPDASTVDIAKARIRAAFPDYVGEAMLDQSVNGYINGSPPGFVNCKVPPDAGPP